MGKWVWLALAFTLFLAVFISPFASTWPDGLEFVAERLGFLSQAVEDPLVEAPIPDYAVPGVENSTIATGLAGLAGTLLVFIVTIFLGKLLKSKKGSGDRG